MENIDNRINKEIILDFLQKMDCCFPVHLSSKVRLDLYADKLLQYATICAEFDGEEIIGAVIGYTNRLSDRIAYICLVGCLPSYQNRGTAKKLLFEFFEVCRNKKIPAVHLYTDATNYKAINLYSNLGFEKYIVNNEKRPDDVHLIYYFEE